MLPTQIQNQNLKKPSPSPELLTTAVLLLLGPFGKRAMNGTGLNQCVGCLQFSSKLRRCNKCRDSGSWICKKKLNDANDAADFIHVPRGAGVSTESYHRPLAPGPEARPSPGVMGFFSEWMQISLQGLPQLQGMSLLQLLLVALADATGSVKKSVC